jgi:hypothetical protein
MKIDDDHPGTKIKKKELQLGCAVAYMPDVSHNHLDPTLEDNELPRGSVGIFLELGSGWENYLEGFEPAVVLFGPTGPVRVYIDELEVLEHP